MRTRPFALALTFALAVYGCGSEPGSTGGAGVADSGATTDAATGGDDSAGAGTSDAGSGGAQDSASGGSDVAASDAGATDAGAGGTQDAGSAGPDTAGTGAADAGAADTGATGGPDTAAAAAAGTPDAGRSGGSWGPDKCAKAGSGAGYAVGQQIDSLPLFDCDTGAPRQFAEVCGADATWLFVAHSHCPTCKSTASYTASVAKKYADKDVAVVHVVYIDDNQTCPSWRKKYGLEGLANVEVYLDKTGAAWSLIKTKNYTAPHAIMTKDRVVTYKAHGLSSTSVSKWLDAALTP